MPTRPGTIPAVRSAKGDGLSEAEIFSLPDMSKMQVKVNIHESLIKKIKVGQKAEIRIESSELRVRGYGHKGLATGRFHPPWMSGGVKQYPRS